VDVAGELFTSTVTRTMLLESVANSSYLCRHILENAPAAGIDEKVGIIVGYTMPSGVRLAKFNQLILAIEPPSTSEYLQNLVRHFVVVVCLDWALGTLASIPPPNYE
jgi:hypothetical protein